MQSCSKLKSPGWLIGRQGRPQKAEIGTSMQGIAIAVGQAITIYKCRQIRLAIFQKKNRRLARRGRGCGCIASEDTIECVWLKWYYVDEERY
jgi:hypothetical protein